MTRKLLSGVLILVVAFFAYDFFLKKPDFSNGAVAPDFTTTLINDQPFALSDLRGNYVLLDFWRSWCGPCIREIPGLIQLHNEYYNRDFKDADNFHIVSVALEKSDKMTKRIIESRGLDWEHHIIDVSNIVMMSSIGQLYDVKELPTKFLINPEGQIMGTDLPLEEMKRLLNARLQ